MPPLVKIFDDPKINVVYKGTKEVGWSCGWCNKTFNPKHATRALNHVNKVKKSGILVCPALIPDVHAARYKALLESSAEKKIGLKRAAEAAATYTEERQAGAVSCLINKRLKLPNTG